MFRKVLVANRGEIAIRAFRAARELGATTVAVFPYEDRSSEHRVRADQAYQIGERGHPVRAYLDAGEVVSAAVASGADAIYPGYGFLSENPDLAEACERAGITFIGPSREVLELTGNKARAIAAAHDAGVPVLASVPPSADIDELLTASTALRYPLFVKAVAGGGGRGMRRVENPDKLRDSIAEAMREADGAFGDPTCFIEEAVIGARHIEVQILADTDGNVVHLRERDCSVQRRHQKVIEIAPAPYLDRDLRKAMCADAVRFAQRIGYSCAGTVEFLLGADGRYVFIEMNPRIQVEHTVTEEVTNVDLVQAQMLIASGSTLQDLGLEKQENIKARGFALQCRITTEDPVNDFRPDIGTISSYRSPGGPGVRLDGGTIYTGADVSPHFDSMLSKMTCRGRDFEAVVGRARRALREFEVTGVSTNIGFLRRLLAHPDFSGGPVHTNFIDSHPELMEAHSDHDAVEKLLDYVADVSVNRPFGQSPLGLDPRSKLPTIAPGASPVAGSRQLLVELGPEGWARALREGKRVGVTDTTFRDAHQSLLATRIRTQDLVAVAPHIAHLTPQLLSVEMWGGATYDVALRFLKEDPWDRLAQLREAIPNVCLQMLLRGRNTVGYTPYPTEVTTAFVEEAVSTGIDVMRIFDALNDVDQMRPAIDAVRETGSAVAEVALCYTGDLCNPAEKLYTLDYYLRLADRIVDAGAHVLAIKDMAGLLRAPAARLLVTALRERFDVPVHLHTHDTPGGQLATLLAAIEAGVDAVDVASAALAGTTSQPSMSALIAATNYSPRETGLDIDAVNSIEPYWEAVRRLYAPFESGLSAPTGRVYRHEIPGGQLSNLRQQAIALGLGDKFEQIEDMYAAANDILGNIVKVTPSSKVVGDLALHLVAANVDPAKFADDPAAFDVPASVLSFLGGELGDPPGGWPEPFRTKALAGRAAPSGVTALTEDELATLTGEAGEVRQQLLNGLLFPGPTRDFETARHQYGNLSTLPTSVFLYGLHPDEEAAIELGHGKLLLLGIEAVGKADERGIRKVLGTINGQLRPTDVRDLSKESKVVTAEKADPSNPRHVPVPFAGVVHAVVQEGETVEPGQTVATIEAMKMEATITAPTGGVVSRVVLSGVRQAEGGDLLIEFA